VKEGVIEVFQTCVVNRLFSPDLGVLAGRIGVVSDMSALKTPTATYENVTRSVEGWDGGGPRDVFTVGSPAQIRPTPQGISFRFGNPVFGRPEDIQQRSHRATGARSLASRFIDEVYTSRSASPRDIELRIEKDLGKLTPLERLEYVGLIGGVFHPSWPRAYEVSPENAVDHLRWLVAFVSDVERWIVFNQDDLTEWDSRMHVNLFYPIRVLVTNLIEPMLLESKAYAAEQWRGHVADLLFILARTPGVIHDLTNRYLMEMEGLLHPLPLLYIGLALSALTRYEALQIEEGVRAVRNNIEQTLDRYFGWAGIDTREVLEGHEINGRKIIVY